MSWDRVSLLTRLTCGSFVPHGSHGLTKSTVVVRGRASLRAWMIRSAEHWPRLTWSICQPTHLRRQLKLRSFLDQRTSHSAVLASTAVQSRRDHVWVPKPRGKNELRSAL